MPDLEQAAVVEWLTVLRPAAANDWPPPVRAIETEGDHAERLQALGSPLNACSLSGRSAVVVRGTIIGKSSPGA